MHDPDCVLCGDLASRGGRLDLGDGLALAADAAPLLPGHALLFTTSHLPSFAASSPAQMVAAEEVLQRLCGLGRYAAGAVLVFEHGTTEATGGSGCVDHAHIHILPIPDPLSERIEPEPRVPETIATLGPRRPFDRLPMLAGQAYFWVAGRHLQMLTIVPRSPERQVLRRIVATLLGLPRHRTWDLYDVDAASSTTDELRALLPDVLARR